LLVNAVDSQRTVLVPELTVHKVLKEKDLGLFIPPTAKAARFIALKAVLRRLSEKQQFLG
jgi:hypothetical protein